MKLKTRNVTILTDDEVALVSGGAVSDLYTFYCGPTQEGGCDTLQTLECHSRECDPYETVGCSINTCLDTEAQCNTEACG